MGLRIDNLRFDVSGWIAWVAFAVGPAWTALGTPYLQYIDTGTPTDGVRQMTGWHGVILRAGVDTPGELITGVDWGQNPLQGVFGSIAQRWEDPTGQGNFLADSTIHTPGPLKADNSTPTDLNFDSHILGDANDFSLINFYESTRPASPPTFFLDRTGIESTPRYGYGATREFPFMAGQDPILLSIGGHINGGFNLSPSRYTSNLDIAYIVTDSAFGSQFNITTTAGLFGGIGIFYAPEPSPFLLILSLKASFACRRMR